MAPLTRFSTIYMGGMVIFVEKKYKIIWRIHPEAKRSTEGESLKNCVKFIQKITKKTFLYLK